MLQQLLKVFQTRNLGPTCSSSYRGPGWPPTIQAGVIYHGKFSRRKADVQWTLDICFVVILEGVWIFFKIIFGCKEHELFSMDSYHT